jgi:hypothetical protein
VTYPSNGNETLDLSVDQAIDPGGKIGKLELFAGDDAALGPDGRCDLPSPIPDGSDGIYIVDLEDVDASKLNEFTIFARVHDLRRVLVEDTKEDIGNGQLVSTKHFLLDALSGRPFVVDKMDTVRVNRYEWQPGWDECKTEEVIRRWDRTTATIESLKPGTDFKYYKRHPGPERECWENVHYTDGTGQQRPVMPKTAEYKDIEYSAAEPAGRLDFGVDSPSTHIRLDFNPLPTRVRLCRADDHYCFPRVRPYFDGSSMGTLHFQASDYVTVNMTDCESSFNDDGTCGTASVRVEDLRLKRVDFWGHKYNHGESGELYLNTADYDEFDDGQPHNPANNQPITRGRIGLHNKMNIAIRPRSEGDGLYARGALIEWDAIWDDRTYDYSPDRTGGILYCPAGTTWEVEALGEWFDVTDDWCNRGEAG